MHLKFDGRTATISMSNKRILYIHITLIKILFFFSTSMLPEVRKCAYFEVYSQEEADRTAK